MTIIERSALVLHSAATMFDLVNDIEAYPQYMDGCESTQVFSRSEHEIVARLVLRKGGIGQAFTTRNRLVRPEYIEMTLEEGPFSRFVGAWRFEALRESACKVGLHLEFELNSNLLNRAAGRLFSRVANNLVATTTRRADELARR